MAALGWQQADQVDIDVGKTAVRHRHLCWLEVDLFVYLAPLATQARPGHEYGGHDHLGPAEPCGDEALCCPHPGVMDGATGTQLNGN